MTNNLSIIRKEGMKALVDKLGPVGTALFLRQFESGYGNYTDERETLLADTSIDEIVSSIQKRKSQL